MKNTILHYNGDCSDKKECKWNIHPAYLFIKDVSRQYASAAENRTYYQCACLQCGKIDDYEINGSERRTVIHIDTKEDLLSMFDTVRERYLSLKENGMDDEQIASQINCEYSLTVNVEDKVIAKNINEYQKTIIPMKRKI